MSHEPRSNEVNASGSPMIRRTAGKVPHVGIVGAGVSGLRCADQLMRYRMKVTILEGRDRVGGRVHQNNSLGHLVDMGANWIHGTKNNPIMGLAEQTNTVTMSLDERQAIFDSLGKILSEKDAARRNEIVWGIIMRATKYSRENATSIPPEKSLYDFFQQAVEKVFPPTAGNGTDDQAAKQREEILQLAEMWGAFIGSPVQRQSLRFLWLEDSFGDENLFVAETYQKILAKTAEPAQKATIKFNHKVKKIASSQGEEDPSVTVDIEGEKSLTFDEVVVTAPLGWLKKNKAAFEPELPKRLQEGIDAIGYGQLDKVYINFPVAFWDEPISSSSPSTGPAKATNVSAPNVAATTGPLRQALSTNSSNQSAHYPGFTHWVRPSYASDTNPQQWNQEAVNLAAMPGSTAHPTLLFYIFGPTSQHIGKLLASNPTSSHNDLLGAFFRPYFSRLPNYSPSNSQHQPKAFLATAWVNDELAGYGSYSNFQVGLERGGQDVEVMRQGMPERGVWLAGEHTAPFDGLGTVTGAYWSGEGVAKRIAQAYCVNIPEEQGEEEQDEVEKD